MRFLIFTITAALLLVLNGCSTPVGSYISDETAGEKIDFAQYRELPRNPLVVIHGLLGARLADSGGEPVWGVFRPRLREQENLCLLAYPMERGKTLAGLRDSVHAVTILDHAEARFAGIGFRYSGYDTLLAHLQEAGYRLGGDAPDLFVFVYDWRRDISENAVLLGEFLEELKVRYPLQGKRFDLLGHSMGGLIARYFAMYGTQALPETGLPEADWRGGNLAARVIAVGTPNDGYFDTFAEMGDGVTLVCRAVHYPGALWATFPSCYQMLPDVENMFDPEFWKNGKRGLADPENDNCWQLFLPDAGTPEERRETAFDHLEKCLARARQFRLAMAADAPKPETTDLYLFCGNAFDTPVAGGFAAGDGKVSVASAVGKNIPWRSVHQIPAAHMGFFNSADFWNDLFYILFFEGKK